MSIKTKKTTFPAFFLALLVAYSRHFLLIFSRSFLESFFPGLSHLSYLRSVVLILHYNLVISPHILLQFL